MPTLRYFPEQFGRYMGTAFTRPNQITFSWSELCRAAVTVGRRSWRDVFQFGTYSIFEIMWRLAIVRANLVENADGTLRKSQAYSRLDPSEKGAISYFLGLVVTKLLAEKLLGVAWLLHLDVYSDLLNPALRFEQKPDFVGLDPANQWVVIESKGRTNGVTTGLLDSAKRQTRSLRNLDGALPALRAALATYFSSQRLCARIRDPEDYEDNAPDVALDPRAFVRAYYRPIMEFIERSSNEPRQDNATGLTFVRAEILGFDAAVEINEAVLRWYAASSEPFGALLRVIPMHVSVLSHFKDQRAANEVARGRLLVEEPTRGEALGADRLGREQEVGLDGVAIRVGTSWSTERMRREPEDRGA